MNSTSHKLGIICEPITKTRVAQIYRNFLVFQRYLTGCIDQLVGSIAISDRKDKNASALAEGELTFQNGRKIQLFQVCRYCPFLVLAVRFNPGTSHVFQQMQNPVTLSDQLSNLFKVIVCCFLISPPSNRFACSLSADTRKLMSRTLSRMANCSVICYDGISPCNPVLINEIAKILGGDMIAQITPK